MRRSAASLVDKLGACVSGLCAVHCALLPLVLVALPAWSSSLLASPVWEWTVLALSAAIGCVAFGDGRRQHGSNAPLVRFLGGMTLFLAARAVAQMSGGCCADHAPAWSRAAVASLSVAGGVGVVCAHMLNVRLRRCCGC